MLRPLNKFKGNGQRYARRTAIEAAIRTCLSCDWQQLRTRAVITDEKSPEFIPLECLVYLIRQEHREGNDQRRDQILKILFGRCESLLTSTLPDRSAPNAAYLREEALGQLGERFARDGTGASPHELDYFEINFNDAFKKLRIDLVRAEKRRVRYNNPLPVANEVEAADISEWDTLDLLLRQPATQEYRLRLLEAIRDLPQEERKAIVLCRLMGFAIESEDPKKQTAATICGVTGRTIRNRLRSADAKLEPHRRSHV